MQVVDKRAYQIGCRQKVLRSTRVSSIFGGTTDRCEGYSHVCMQVQRATHKCRR